MKKIGLALSGGGIRAAIFHLGVLKCLAENRQLSKIASISTVSGASLVVAAIFAIFGDKWPSSSEYIKTLPAIRDMILHKNLQTSALAHLFLLPRYWRNRVQILAHVLEEKWGICGNMQDLPSRPFWEINCTTFETGGNFRFRRDYMGDAKIGYVRRPALPISHVIAASAAFPVLIGPYILETEKLKFTDAKRGGQRVNVAPRYSLWDGGVYDNMGLSALYKNGQLDKEIDFLIVSNASQALHPQKRRGNISPANLRRLLDISQNQVNVINEERVINDIVKRGQGFYVKIGIEYPTTLRAPAPQDFDMLFDHGYEMANASI